MKEEMMGMMYEAPAFKDPDPELEYNPIPMVDQSPTLGNLFAALAKAQGAMKPAKMDGKNPHFGSSYATLDSILDSVRKPLADNELAVIQRTHQTNGTIDLVTTLGHSSGEWMSSKITLILQSMARKGDPIEITMQSLGSAITYARRYGLAAITGAVSDVDDDGNVASAPAKATAPTTTVRPDSDHICPIHKVAFKRYSKPDGEAWYSHKLADGKWCNEAKAPPASTPPQTPAQPQGEAPAPTAGEPPVEPGQAAMDEAFGRADHAPEIDISANAILDLGKQLGWNSTQTLARIRQKFTSPSTSLPNFTDEERTAFVSELYDLIAAKA